MRVEGCVRVDVIINRFIGMDGNLEVLKWKGAQRRSPISASCVPLATKTPAGWKVTCL